MRVSSSRVDGRRSPPSAWKRAALLLAATAAMQAPAAAQQEWLPLRRDGLHDPKGPAIGQLQEPRDALSRLAPDTTGNLVRWVEALEKGQIAPREKLRPQTTVRELDKDILLMHPGPINRGVEITSDVADSRQSIILTQVENGVAIRMAVLYLLAAQQ